VPKAQLTGVEHLTPLVLREPEVLGDPVLDVAGLDRLPVPEDLEDGKQEAVPSRHLAHGLRAIAHARQAIRATKDQRISVCSPFTGVSSRSSRPPSRDIPGPSP